MNDSDIIINKSKFFLLYYFYDECFLGETRNLLNTYLYLNGESKFCVLYRFSGKKSYYDFEARISMNRHYLYMIDISKDKVLYVFDIPESVKPALELYKQGRFSELPDKEGLMRFLKHFFGVSRESKVIKVLVKDEALRKELEEKIGTNLDDAELSSIPDLEKENFKIKENEEKEKFNDFGGSDYI